MGCDYHRREGRKSGVLQGNCGPLFLGRIRPKIPVSPQEKSGLQLYITPL